MLVDAEIELDSQPRPARAKWSKQRKIYGENASLKRKQFD